MPSLEEKHAELQKMYESVCAKLTIERAHGEKETRRANGAEAREKRLKADKDAIIDMMEAICAMPMTRGMNTLKEAVRQTRARQRGEL